MNTYTDYVTCPGGHHFMLRRKLSSGGRTIKTRCPKCQVNFDTVAAPAPVGGAADPVRRRPLLERDIEAQLVKRVQQLGGECRKVAWLGRVGAPDRVVMLPPEKDRFTYGTDYGRTIWVEVKAPGGAAKFPKNAHERAQHREHERMRRVGQRVVVVDSFEQIEELLK